MRQASIAMSWVADEKPTSTANTARGPRLSDGSVPDSSQRPTMIEAWQASIHERRWPTHPLNNGIGSRSTRGAQRNLKLEIIVTRLKKPMTSSERPDERSHAESVSKTRK